MAYIAPIVGAIGTALSSIFGRKTCKIVYRSDPKTEAELKEQKDAVEALTKGKKDLKEKLTGIEERLRAQEKAANDYKTATEAEKKKQQDPKLFRQNEAALFDNFVKNVEKITKSTPQPQERVPEGAINVGFVGRVSTGKSSILNALTGSTAKVGMGRTTKDAEVITRMRLNPASTREMAVFDIPGDDDQFSYWSMDVVTFMSLLDILIVVYDDTISYTDRITRVALALGKKVIFLRNKLDLGENPYEPNQVPWQEVMKQDRADVADLLNASQHAGQCEVFGVSAWKACAARRAAENAQQEGASSTPQAATEQVGAGYEWDKFRRHLTSLVDEA